MRSDPTVPRTLDRHDQRRRQGLATVSLLVGPIQATTTAWSGHVAGALQVDAAAPMSSPTLAAAIVTTACCQCPLLDGATAELARRLDRPLHQALADRSGRDLEQLWRSVDHGDHDLLQLLRTVCTVPIERWPAEIAERLPGWRGPVALDRLLPTPPAIWIAEPADCPGWLNLIAGPVAALAAAVPRWAIGVGVRSDSFNAYRTSAGDSRDATLLCGGAIEIGLPTVEPAAKPLGSDPDDESDDDPARSAAERFLHELLSARWPNLFALNVALSFPFGSRPAEADLYADTLRLAIEVDGYHHFQDPVCYRRDRRKDWAYQSNGYRVVRVLAEDVVPRATEILDQIAVVVEHCRDRQRRGGSTGNP